jgi:hypothetical protein
VAGEIPNLDAAVKPVLDAVQAGFWIGHWEFVISLVVGVGGLFFSILAFREARQAKKAAREAGVTVKLQTITIELTEIAQRLNKLEPDIKFRDARDFLAEISQRLIRLTVGFGADPEFKRTIDALRAALLAAKTSLNDVRPTNPKEADAPQVVYNAIESNFATINDTVSELLGLFEKRSTSVGDDHHER